MYTACVHKYEVLHCIYGVGGTVWRAANKILCGRMMYDEPEYCRRSTCMWRLKHFIGCKMMAYLNTTYKVHMYIRHMTYLCMSMYKKKFKSIVWPCKGGGSVIAIFLQIWNPWINHVLWENIVYTIKNLKNCILFHLSHHSLVRVFKYILSSLSPYVIEWLLIFKFKLLFSDSVEVIAIHRIPLKNSASQH